MSYNSLKTAVETIKDINKAEQRELPLKLQGENISDLPEDLYIPPNSLRIFLDSFEGPLDLLLYFIKKQNLDIANIDVSLITDQYISYINLMEELQFDLAGEYLVMSAYLAEIKSRILLPSLSEDDEIEDDPRSELIRRLQEYERYKKASESLNDIPMVNRDFYLASAAKPEFEASKEKPKITGEDLVLIFNELKEIYRNLNATDSWENFISYLQKDNRMGSSHMSVPGHDGKKGFGGACFPKDTVALAKSAEAINQNLKVLEAAIKSNNTIRKTYTEIDSREKDQNISFDDKI